MAMANDIQPTPPEEPEESLGEHLWWLSRWAIGGLLQFVVLVGTFLLSALTFIIFRDSGHPWLGLAAALTVWSSGQSGIVWVKTRWIIHVMPEIVKDYEEKTAKGDQ